MQILDAYCHFWRPGRSDCGWPEGQRSAVMGGDTARWATP